MKIKYRHTMIRVRDINNSKAFYCDLLGLEEVRRVDNETGKFTLVFLRAPGNDDTSAGSEDGKQSPLIELTFNWDNSDSYSSGRNFGHLCFEVEDIYKICRKLLDNGIVINRPPRDGYMAFVCSPDNISIELLQSGSPKAPAEPWVSMSNSGTW